MKVPKNYLIIGLAFIFILCIIVLATGNIDIIDSGTVIRTDTVEIESATVDTVFQVF